MTFGASVNLWAVLVAAVASFVLGGLWYGPLFGKSWAKLAKVKAMKKGMGSGHLAMFISSLVTAYVLAVFIGLAGAGVGTALAVGFWTWLGFYATLTLGGVLWKGEPINLYWLNNGYGLLNLLLMALVISYM